MLTAERVRELLSYDPSTGEFRWKVNHGRKVKAGTVAGGVFTKDCGKQYRRIRIDRKNHTEHRLAWLMINGSLPAGEIDHIDGDGLNNRIHNLRDVSHAENMKNLRLLATSTSGISGVGWHKRGNKWQARVRVNNKRIHLGLFNTKSEALAARKVALKKYGFHENHGSERVALTRSAE